MSCREKIVYKNMRNIILQILGAINILSMLLVHNVSYYKKGICIFFAIYMLLFTICFGKYKVNNESEISYKNKILVLYVCLTELMILLGMFMEHVFKGIRCRVFITILLFSSFIITTN